MSDQADGAAGQAVVLLHELGGGPANVEPVAALLRDRGALVLTPTLPGHATRWEDLTDVTWLDWCRAGEAAVDEAHRRTGGPVVVAGVSIGAALALRFASARPAAVGAVVAINPALRSNSLLLPLVPVLRFVVRSIATGAKNAASGPPQSYHRLPTKVLTQLTPLWRDVLGGLGSIEQPVTIVRSRSEGEPGAQTAALIRGAVASHHVDEVVLPDAGHVATVGPDVPAVARAVADAAHLAGARPRPTPATAGPGVVAGPRDPGEANLMNRWADFVNRRRWVVVAASLIFIALAGALGAKVSDRLLTGGYIDQGSPSAQAERQLANRFGAGTPNLVLLASTSGSVDATDARRAGLDLTRRLTREAMSPRSSPTGAAPGTQSCRRRSGARPATRR